VKEAYFQNRTYSNLLLNKKGKPSQSEKFITLANVSSSEQEIGKIASKKLSSSSSSDSWRNRCHCCWIYEGHVGRRQIRARDAFHTKDRNLLYTESVREEIGNKQGRKQAGHQRLQFTVPW
jgi:hypothetical protein